MKEDDQGPCAAYEGVSRGFVFRFPEFLHILIAHNDLLNLREMMGESE